MRRANVLLASAWLASVAIAIASRPLLPVDETRYASVAWEMWLRGQYLVPHLNGAPYSDKPPLLFWLILAGWRVVGPVELCARLVGPACGVASLALVAPLAKRLWPDRGSVARLAPIVLASTLVWLVYSTLLLFDTVLTVCVLLAVIGILDTRRGRWHGLVLIAIGTGLGILAKGPVLFIHVLPAMFLVRWWDVRQQSGEPRDTLEQPLRRWPLAVAVATLAGIAIALAWAIPAAMSGGPAYERAIFIGQTAGRVVNSFAHRRPLWWYVPNLIWMLLPWIVWPVAWRWARTTRGTKAWRDTFARDRGLRLCAAVVVPAFAMFSVVSGKQVHYLLPEVPFVALAIASVLADATDERDADGRTVRRVQWVALGQFVVLAVVSVVASRPLHERYDLRPIAAHLSSIERAGDPIAHEGRYAGQYTFLGRLRHPLVEIPRDSVAEWLAAHPNGRVVMYSRSPNARGPGIAEIVHRLGGRFVIVRAASPSGQRGSPPTPSDDRIRHEPSRIENP
ncbi:MAG TPA: glycosyltransferase family 39 protein [Gemmatimonadaceae bacterium]|nr:glycosyltransferase family 39 protein [Gemmatimonadaceae bacterium]